MKITLPFSCKIAGEAGYGIMNTGGPLLAKCFSRRGYFVFCYPEYPSLIRGGHNAYQINIDSQLLYAPTKKIDFLIALNSYAFLQHQDELKKNGELIYDPSTIKFTKQNSKLKIDNSRIPVLSGSVSLTKAKTETFLRRDLKLFPVPLEEIAQKNGDKIIKNVVSVGAFLALIGYEFKVLAEILEDMFAKKGRKVISANMKAGKGGYNYMTKLKS